MKRFNYSSIIFILFFTLFAGCNNLTSKPVNNSDSVDSISITGQVTLDINAFPSELNKKTSSRSAMFDDKQTFSFDEGALTVKAVHNISKYEIQGNVLPASGGVFTYEINLSMPGDWTVIAQGTTQNGITFIGKSVLSVKVSSNGSLIVPDAVPNTYLKPIFKEGEKGNINLKVMNQVPHTESGEYLISWKWGTDKPEGFNDVDVTMSYNTNSKSDRKSVV